MYTFFLLLLMCVFLTAFSYVYLASVCYIIMPNLGCEIHFYTLPLIKPTYVLCVSHLGL